MTQIDCLIEVAKQAERGSHPRGSRAHDRALLYFIDMTIVHVCNSLGAHPETQDAAEAHVSLVHAAA